ncbi:MAG: HAMP domain-containing histidine kinase [Lachnospiraceae bacterium]|jgi:signal transduction histidine kinase|nr:HAMP domain-containing histidine kinase [Lachnospiraceae bacterium]
MEMGLCFFAALLFVIVLICGGKILRMRRSAREIAAAFADRLSTETNTLIDISSHDRYMCSLAADINTQLRKLRGERLRYQQGNREIMDAVTNISHDLRTPLTAICGYLDLLRQTELTADAVRYLDIIEERVDVLRQLTEELFGYSAAVSAVGEDGRDRHEEISEISLNAALEEILSVYYAALKKRRITPSVTMPEATVTRRLNKSLLFRIFGNIISNALKYSDGDLEITLSEQGEIVFANHAASLDELQVMRLFDRYYTVENAVGATGLGLSIARELTGQMGGTITAQYRDKMLRISLTF